MEHTVQRRKWEKRIFPKPPSFSNIKLYITSPLYITNEIFFWCNKEHWYEITDDNPIWLKIERIWLPSHFCQEWTHISPKISTKEPHEAQNFFTELCQDIANVAIIIFTKTLFVYTWLLYFKRKCNYNEVYVMHIFLKTKLSWFWILWMFFLPL